MVIGELDEKINTSLYKIHARARISLVQPSIYCRPDSLKLLSSVM